jgi:hypothetical protein
LPLLLRRPQLKEGAEEKTIEAGDFHADIEARAVTVCGQAIHLTPKEYDRGSRYNAGEFAHRWGKSPRAVNQNAWERTKGIAVRVYGLFMNCLRHFYALCSMLATVDD